MSARGPAHVSHADVRHLHWLRDQRPDDTVDLVVVTTGTHAYRCPDGIAVVPLSDRRLRPRSGS